MEPKKCPQKLTNLIIIKNSANKKIYKDDIKKKKKLNKISHSHHMTKEAGLFMAAQTYCHNVTSLYIYTNNKKGRMHKRKTRNKTQSTKEKKERHGQRKIESDIK